MSEYQTQMPCVQENLLSMYIWPVNPVPLLVFAAASDRCNSFSKGTVGALWVCPAFHSVAITLNALITTSRYASMSPDTTTDGKYIASQNHRRWQGCVPTISNK